MDLPNVVLTKFGSIGLLQKCQLAFVFMPTLALLWATDFFFIIAAYSNIQPFTCTRNVSVESYCSDCQFDDTFLDETMVEKWNLFCQSDLYRIHLQTAYFIGWSFGLLSSNYIAWRIGPKKLLFASTVLYVMFSCVSTYSKFYWIFLCLQCLVGLGTAAAFGSLFIIVYDTIKRSMFPLVYICLSIGRSTSLFVLLAAAYVTKCWQHVNLVISAPVLLLLALIYWFTPESPTWLMIKGRFPETELLLRRLIGSNSEQFESFWTEAVQNLQNDDSEVSIRKKRHAFDVLKEPKYLRRFLSLSIACGAGKIAYYTTTYGFAITKSLGWGLYVNSFICASLEIIGWFCCLVTVSFGLNRQWPAMISAVIGGILCMLASGLSGHLLVVSIFVAISKPFLTIADVLLFLFALESFPAETALSICLHIYAIVSIGAILAVSLVIRLENDVVVPLLMCGIIATVCSLALFLTPDVRVRKNKRRNRQLAEVDRI